MLIPQSVTDTESTTLDIGGFSDTSQSLSGLGEPGKKVLQKLSKLTSIIDRLASEKMINLLFLFFVPFFQIKRKKEKKKHKHKHKHKHHRGDKKEKDRTDKEREVTALSSESSGPPSPDMGLTF